MVKIFITGKSGVGKTTLVKHIINLYGEFTGGFYTQEVRENKRRLGFDIISLSGEKGMLARSDYRSKFRIGRYGINLADLERVGLKALDEAVKNKQLIVIDEIGKMELFSQSFKEKVIEVINSSKKILAVITLSKDEFVESLKLYPGFRIFELNRTNFDDVLKEIIKILEIK